MSIISLKQPIKEYFYSDGLVLPEGLNQKALEKGISEKVKSYIENTLKFKNASHYETTVEELYPFTDKDPTNFLNVSIALTLNVECDFELQTYDYSGWFDCENGFSDEMLEDIRKVIPDIILEVLKENHAEIRSPIVFEDSESKTIEELLENVEDYVYRKYDEYDR